jgi:hypothetical protein
MVRRRSTRRKSNKMIFGGELNNVINPEDIKYQDHDVAILHPHVKKGVLVYHHYTNPPGLDLCEIGLKSGLQMQKEGIAFGRIVYHDSIFFRAPYYPNENHNYDSIENEYEGLFSKKEELYDKKYPIICIRVDPNKTYVYSSEIRVYAPENQKKTDLEESKILLSDYLKIKNDNMILKNKFYDIQYKDRENMILAQNLLTHKATIKYELKLQYPYVHLMQGGGEILVHLGHMTPDYFVHCTK